MADFNPFDTHDGGGNNPDSYAAPTKAQGEIPDFPTLTPPPAPATPPVQPAMEAKPSPGGKKRLPLKVLIPCAILVALLLTFLLAGNAILVLLSPATALNRGMEKLSSDVSMRVEQSPYQAFSVLGRTLLTGGKLAGDLVYNDGWNDMQLAFDATYGGKSAMFEGGLDVTVDGISADGRMFLSKNKAALTSSFLNDNWYGVTFKTLTDDLRASALPEILGLSDEDIGEIGKTIDQLTASMDMDYKDTMKPYEQVIKDFTDSLETSTSNDKTRVGGEMTSCSVITITLSEKELRSFVMDLIGVMADDENIRDAYTSSMAASGYAQEDAQMEFESLVGGLKAGIKSSMDRYTGDLEIVYYLYQGSVVKMDISCNPAIDGEVFLLKASYDFGKNPAKDDWTMDLATTSPYGDEMNTNMVYHSNINGKNYEDSLVMTMQTDWDTVGFTVSNTWDRDSGKLMSTLAADEGSGQQSLTLGSNLTCEKDSFSFEMNDLSGIPAAQEITLAMALSAQVGAAVSEPTFVNLDKWDASVIAEFESAFMTLNNALYGGYADWE